MPGGREARGRSSAGSARGRPTSAGTVRRPGFEPGTRACRFSPARPLNVQMLVFHRGGAGCRPPRMNPLYAPVPRKIKRLGRPVRPRVGPPRPGLVSCPPYAVRGRFPCPAAYWWAAQPKTPKGADRVHPDADVHPYPAAGRGPARSAGGRRRRLRRGSAGGRHPRDRDAVQPGRHGERRRRPRAGDARAGRPGRGADGARGRPRRHRRLPPARRRHPRGARERPRAGDPPHRGPHRRSRGGGHRRRQPPDCGAGLLGSP